MGKYKDIAKDLEMNESGLSVVLSQIKSVQGAYGLFKHFSAEIKTYRKQISNMEKEMEGESFSLPNEQTLNFFTMAQAFQTYIANTHPYESHLESAAYFLGLGENIYLKTALFERFLQSVDKIGPNFYQNPLHKQECRDILIQTLEDLYEQIEDLEEGIEHDEEDDF